ncbi:phenylacetic acid degradation protein PaaN [Martelella lutilitoris]|uniref:Phenylacetic acid degradation protein PaaN n=1 Tax=Martelella lutilitoris TaxID=2583532 RepID=A0A7T7KLK5_9HYPH|nr:phenylacetic acid degradation protein PaaN [Martelella lutilitoris]QQM30785.1 phenylacetic acid degradation protein PaaN [Martelella lutilitoris]
MTNLYDRHSALLARAVEALRARAFWTPFPEVPSGKVYGGTAKADGIAAFEALVGNAFDMPAHPETRRVGRENAPWGKSLSITYPAADPATLIAASEKAAEPWASADPETRAGILLEALTRLNAMSFLIGHATMHTTGQAFPMAFQAGGPHAQDRGLEAVAAAYAEMTGSATAATWEKPQGKREPITVEKRWRIVPRGLSLMIGCQTFPNWNGYPGLFASLATGNTVIVKPHPGAILPLALTVKVLREVLAEEGFSPDVVLLAADEPGAEITKALVETRAFSIIDYTGSSVFAAWLRKNADGALVFTEETGVNSITITGTDDFAGMCDNIAFSLSLYSGQMCTSPQNLYLPKGGIETDEGHKSFAEVVGGIVAAIDSLLEDGAQASSICGAIANAATFERIEKARHAGRVVRESRETGLGASATPLLVVADGREGGLERDECFGPVSFFIACDDAHDAIARASAIAAEKGAITAALYATDGALIEEAANAFSKAGVNLSVNLTGNIYVNQSAAFSDYHVTGANPSGNASLTDTAFVAPRFRRVMIRWPRAA